MIITDILTKNANLYGDEVSLIEVNPEIQERIDKAWKEYDLRSFENPVWLYAAVRNALYRKGSSIEVLESFEPGFRMFGQWWQQLFGESEGKDGKGILPMSVEFTTDLHSLGQMIQQGERNIFETVIIFSL